MPLKQRSKVDLKPNSHFFSKTQLIPSENVVVFHVFRWNNVFEYHVFRWNNVFEYHVFRWNNVISI